jgi:hypothetical protein
VVVDSGLSTRSGHIFYPEERLRGAAAHLKEQAHISIVGLPGAGKSTFVRQLAAPEIRERLGLDRNYLMVLLDGHEFAHSSLEYVWGAILAALNRARSNLSVVCKKEDAQEISHEGLRGALRSFRNYRFILILDHCSSLVHMEPEQSACCSLLHLDRRYSPTLVTVPDTPFHLPPCIPEVRDQFVPIDLTLSPQQALQFLDTALPQLDMDRALKDRLSREIVNWVGGNLYLLDSVCYWAAKASEYPSDRHTYPDFSRVVYESCLADAESLFAVWWKILDEREQMILLAMDELQRLTTVWQNIMGELSGKGLVQRQSDRYLVFPKMFSDYVSRQLATRDVGPFRLDLKRIQTVYVNGKPRNLSRGQACAFFRLFVHRNQVVPYGRLYADLHSPYVDIAENTMHEMDASSMMSVDRGLKELREALTAGKLVERVPPDDNIPLRGYRLAVSSLDQDG